MKAKAMGELSFEGGAACFGVRGAAEGGGISLKSFQNSIERGGREERIEDGGWKRGGGGHMKPDEALEARSVDAFCRWKIERQGWSRFIKVKKFFSRDRAL